MAPFPQNASQSTISNSPQHTATQVSVAASSSPSTTTGLGLVAAPGTAPGGGASSDVSIRNAPLVTNAPQQHKRVYQACIPCRRRKVRCDLGSVDDPSDPPCVRCRRESKECFFSATRRKRKGDSDADEFAVDDYIVRNGRKRVNVSDSPSHRPSMHYASDMSNATRPPGSRSHPLRRPDVASGVENRTLSKVDQTSVTGQCNAQVENIEAQNVMRARLYGTHDALDLLYKAATDGPTIPDPLVEIADHNDSISDHSKPHTSHSHRTPTLTPCTRSFRHGNTASSAQVSQSVQPITLPEFTTTHESHSIDRHPSIVDQPGYAEALKGWTRFRFVRAGWFTALEAIEYIDYYYEYLSPLTPISPPTFRKPASHLTLLTEEPILTVSLLTIASRYRRMPGTGGHCRSHAIHEQLWSYLRGMIERCLWGQESFGGGFCGSGANEFQTSSTAPWRGLRKGSLRTLGTIESLMILTEWHPRALHFPPAEALDELVLPLSDTDHLADQEVGNQKPPAGVGGRRIESWLEPAWRSDRMCWMLLSTAMGLAYELGVFDDMDELFATGTITRPEYEDESYRLRAYRIKRLLLIYATQLAGRLGWTNMVPESLRRNDPVVSKRRPTSVEGTTPGASQSVVSNSFNYIPDLELDDQIIHCWAGISNLMQIGNERLFRNRKHTTDIIQSNKYLSLLEDLGPLLTDWWNEFERFRLPPYIRYVLKIEYEYVRIYINSLSLQAVVERCATNAGCNAQAAGSGCNPATLSPQTQSYLGKLSLGSLGGLLEADQAYIHEVVNGSRSLLRTVVNGLLPGDYLKHAPVRTYFRIISGAMFLLKTFAIGATRSDVEESIVLMDETVSALRNCVVDDVHLGIRFADLLESLTSRLRNRFVQAIPPVSASDDDKSSTSFAIIEGGQQRPTSVPTGNGNGSVTSVAGLVASSNALSGPEGHLWAGHFQKWPGMWLILLFHSLLSLYFLLYLDFIFAKKISQNVLQHLEIFQRLLSI